MSRPTCNAKTRAGGACRRAPMPNGRCLMHGGKSPGGVASPAFRTGRHSKYLPARLLERYQEALDDGVLLELRAEIGLLDTRLAELLEWVDTGESGGAWLAAKRALSAYFKAQRDQNPAAATEALGTLRACIEVGLQDCAAWGEIRELVAERRKTVESERKRLIEAQQMLSTQEAMSLLAVVADTIRRHVSDAGTLRAISADLSQLLAVGAGERASAN
jgi:hypothetical protein